MNTILLLKGLLIGLAVSVPLGPMGMVCVTRTLNHGRYSGFFSGLGAATADTIFALVTGFGITFIINFIHQQELYFQIIGGIFIMYFGWRLFSTNPVKKFRNRKLSKNKLAQDFVSVLLFTLSNPMAILLFLGIFAAVNVVPDQTSLLQNIILFAGVFVGASLWWFFLSSLVYSFRTRLRLRGLLWVNRISGGFMVLLGSIVIISLFFPR